MDHVLVAVGEVQEDIIVLTLLYQDAREGTLLRIGFRIPDTGCRIWCPQLMKISSLLQTLSGIPHHLFTAFLRELYTQPRQLLQHRRIQQRGSGNMQTRERKLAIEYQFSGYA